MFEYAFVRLAFMASGVAACLAAAAGIFLVLRSQSFAGHALGHVGFAGAAAALLVGAPPFAGLLAASTAAGLAMGAIGEGGGGSRDVAIGLVLAASLAGGLLLLHFFQGSASPATSLLFGNVFAVDARLLRLLASVSLATLAALALLARPLLVASLQPELAEVLGLRPRLMSTLFLGLVGVATAVAAQIVGVLLVFVLTVAPAASAVRLARRWVSLTAMSIGLAIGAAWVGIALAYETDWPPSACITFVACALYGMSWALSLRTSQA